MVLGALCLLFWPTIKSRSGFLSRSHIFGLFILFASFAFYFCFNNPTELRQWLDHGKRHYELLVEYERLGGIDGIIAKIKQKLAQNPSDRQGWMILGKLYKAKGDEKAAEEAFKKAGQ